MYNREMLGRLIRFIRQLNGINDKEALSAVVQERFLLDLNGKVFSCPDFALRFCYASGKSFGNTVVALSRLVNFDDRPFIVCVVTPYENVLLLANTTFVSRISHSSQGLSGGKIRGSVNGPDILRRVYGLENTPENFEELFSLHERIPFNQNLERLVESTASIVPKKRSFDPSGRGLDNISNAPFRAIDFFRSEEYLNLLGDLDWRVDSMSKEIAIASSIDNVNIRGRVIEYLIASDDEDTKARIVYCLHNRLPLPRFRTKNSLGDCCGYYGRFNTATEIKSKMLYKTSNPKGYNIDKLLAFLAEPESVYMVYIVGVDENGRTNAALCSVFDERLMRATVRQPHWAGRAVRGAAQFMGGGLVEILNKPDCRIDADSATGFIEWLISQ